MTPIRRRRIIETHDRANRYWQEPIDGSLRWSAHRGWCSAAPATTAARRSSCLSQVTGPGPSDAGAGGMWATSIEMHGSKHDPARRRRDSAVWRFRIPRRCHGRKPARFGSGLRGWKDFAPGLIGGHGRDRQGTPYRVRSGPGRSPLARGLRRRFRAPANTHRRQDPGTDRPVGAGGRAGMPRRFGRVAGLPGAVTFRETVACPPREDEAGRPLRAQPGMRWPRAPGITRRPASSCGIPPCAR